MNQRRIEILLLSFTIALIVSVTFVGISTVDNLKKIEHQSEKIYQPNKIILHLGQLISELRNSESSVRSYNLYRSEDYLISYQKSVQRIDAHFDSLYFYQKKSNLNKSLLDSVNAFVERKFVLLNEQLWIRDNLKVLNELNVISKKIEEVAVRDTSNAFSVAKNTSEAKKKKGLFGRIFKKKEKEDGYIPVTEPKYIMDKSKLADVKKEVQKVKNRQAADLAEMNTRELELISKDKVIMEKLEDIVVDLEKSQNETLKKIAQENIRETGQADFQLRVFGILFFTILTLSAILSIYYFYYGKKYQHRLKEAANEARRLAETRQHFLSNMSHEMRTPLNAIVGFSEQLLQSNLNREPREQVEIVNNSAQHLLKLVNNLLDKAKIDSGKIKPEEIVFYPATVIDDCLNLVSVSARTKGISLRREMNIDRKEILVGDPMLLKQVILNVLGNAVKFTEKGTVTLKANLDFARLNLEIADTGVGIPEDKLAHVFNEFEQADSSVSRKFGGSGLGLWITKKIVETQNGKIDLASEVEKGSVFKITIPYRKADAAAEQMHNVQVHQEKVLRLKGKKILVVDDEVYNRKLVSAVLKKYEVNLMEADSGGNALTSIKADLPDIVLADINMPEMDGAKLTRILRLEMNSALPVIAITADLTDEKRKLFSEAGIDDFVGKPFSENELVTAILKNINHAKV